MNSKIDLIGTQFIGLIESSQIRCAILTDIIGNLSAFEVILCVKEAWNLGYAFLLLRICRCQNPQVPLKG